MWVDSHMFCRFLSMYLFPHHKPPHPLVLLRGTHAHVDWYLFSMYLFSLLDEVLVRKIKKHKLFSVTFLHLACKDIRFSSLFATGEVSRGGTSVTQLQKYHTDDANQCLHNKSRSHEVLNIHLSNFTCLLVDFGKLLSSSANELQQNSNSFSREDYIPQILTVLSEILRVYIWPLWPSVFCLSFVNNS